MTCLQAYKLYVATFPPWIRQILFKLPTRPKEVITLEPTTLAKILAQVAQQLADKKKRERLLVIIGAIIAIPLLLLMMMFYIITSPLRWIEEWFSQDEIGILEDIRSEQGFPPWGTLEAGIVEGFYCPFPGINWIVTSPFGMRINPITGITEMHQGIDISWGGSHGTPIGAVADGIVTFAGFSPSAGNWVIIYHGDIGGFQGVVSVYMHNDVNRVVIGQTVYAGEIIGTLGTTGASTGPHLHLEIRVNGFNGLSGGRASGTALDPLHFIGLPNMRPTPDDDDGGYTAPY